MPVVPFVTGVKVKFWTWSSGQAKNLGLINLPTTINGPLLRQERISRKCAHGCANGTSWQGLKGWGGANLLAFYPCRCWRPTMPLQTYSMEGPLQCTHTLHIQAWTMPTSLITPRACAKGKVIEFVFLSFSRQKKFEIVWTSPFKDFWAYQKLWGHSYLTYLYLLLDWFASTRGNFSCFLLSGPLCQPFYLRPKIHTKTSQPFYHSAHTRAHLISWVGMATPPNHGHTYIPHTHTQQLHTCLGARPQT